MVKQNRDKGIGILEHKTRVKKERDHDLTKDKHLEIQQHLTNRKVITTATKKPKNKPRGTMKNKKK